MVKGIVPASAGTCKSPFFFFGDGRMKVMIFLDYDNFCHNIRNIGIERKQDRVLDNHKVHKFVLDYLSNNEQYKNVKLTHVRTYLYTGEYTNTLFKRIKDAVKNPTTYTKDYFVKLLQKTEKRHEGQKKLFERAKTYPFFEIRKKPLQFTKDKGIFQKGVDVQLAVDLVSNAFLNTYDIAVLFSGDIDLLESVRTVKNLGKHIILFSHYTNIAKEMVRDGDMFVNLQHLKEDKLNQFTHIFQKK